MNCDMEKVVCFLGCRVLRKSCLYPQRFTFSLLPLCFSWLLLSHKIYFNVSTVQSKKWWTWILFFVMKVKDVKKNKKKQPVHTLKPYEQRNYFLLLVSPLVWLDICCICNKKTKNYKNKTTKVLLSYCTVLRFFFLKGTVWGVVGHKHQCAFFCVFLRRF